MKEKTEKSLLTTQEVIASPKEPFEMTYEEFRDTKAWLPVIEQRNSPKNETSQWDNIQSLRQLERDWSRLEWDTGKRFQLHREIVVAALKDGKTVPECVLANHPDLAEKYGEKHTPLKQSEAEKMKEIIKQKIEQSTAANPVTSTRLVEIVRRETGETITARRIRFIVKQLRDNGTPILATRKGKKGFKEN